MTLEFPLGRHTSLESHLQDSSVLESSGSGSAWDISSATQVLLALGREMFFIGSMALLMLGCLHRIHGHSMSLPSWTAAQYTSRQIPIKSIAKDMHWNKMKPREFKTYRWCKSYDSNENMQPSHCMPCCLGQTGSIQTRQLIICAAAMIIDILIY